MKKRPFLSLFFPTAFATALVSAAFCLPQAAAGTWQGTLSLDYNDPGSTSSSESLDADIEVDSSDDRASFWNFYGPVQGTYSWANEQCSSSGFVTQPEFLPTAPGEPSSQFLSFSNFEAESDPFQGVYAMDEFQLILTVQDVPDCVDFAEEYPFRLPASGDLYLELPTEGPLGPQIESGALHWAGQQTLSDEFNEVTLTADWTYDLTYDPKSAACESAEDALAKAEEALAKAKKKLKKAKDSGSKKDVKKAKAKVKAAVQDVEDAEAEVEAQC